ncbi:MAG: hypothetical protein WB998_12260 [Solirubrobacteraceae bacterium]
MSRTPVSLRVVATLLASICALAALALGGGTAQAAITHPYTGTSFGPNGTGAGNFGRVVGVAVDSRDGDVFVLDNSEGGRVYKFDASGEPVDFSGSGTNVIEGVGSANDAEEEVAVDGSTGPDAGDIYVANNKGVRIYGETGALLEELTGGEMCGVAVDQSGNVYVGIYPETVRRYAPSSSPVTNSDEDASIVGVSYVCNVAADEAGDVYVASFSGGITKYDALQFGSLAPAGASIDGSARTLAVDQASKEVFADSSRVVVQYDTSVEPAKMLDSSGGSGAPGALVGSYGVAVNAGGELYVGDGGRVEIFGGLESVPGVQTEAAGSLTASQATLHGSVEPSGVEVTSCVFEYGEGSLDHSVPCTPAPPYTGSPVEVSAVLSALSPGATYRYRIAASTLHGTYQGEEQSFTTAGPKVSSESVENIGAGSVSLGAYIGAGGETTTYRVEYGMSSAYGTTTAPVELEGNEAFVQVPIRGLAPKTTYHFRFVAVNALATTYGEDTTFTTAEVITNESVSQVGSTNATIRAEIDPRGILTSYEVEYGTSTAYGSSTSPVDIGAGEARVPVVAHLSELQPGIAYHFRFVAISGQGNAVGADTVFSTHVLSISDLPDGRNYEMVTPADNQGAEVYAPQDAGHEGQDTIFNAEYPFAAAADGRAVTYIGSPTSGGNGNQGNGGGNQFLARRNADGSWTQINLQPNGYPHPLYAAFSPDLRYGVVSSPEPLTADAPPEPFDGLYLRDNDSGSYQSLLTRTPPNRSGYEFGSPARHYAPDELGEAGWPEHFAGGSADYSHLLFEANDVLASGAVDPGERSNNLYEWVGGELHTVNILPDGGAAPNASFGSEEQSSGAHADFSHVISSDGSHIFWTDLTKETIYVREDGVRTEQIAEGATYLTASANGSRVLYTKAGDLYEDDLEDGITRDLAPGAEALGIAGASEDLGYVYLVGRGSLAPGSTAGDSNLYLLHNGQTRFIGSLNGTYEELYNGEVRPWQSDMGLRDAEVTPSGHDLVFMAESSLTGYDNVNSKGVEVPEVYVFDADSGALSCVSCDPSGVAPTVHYGSRAGSAGGLLAISGQMTYQLRTISEDGSRVFFESAQPLVPQAQNGRLNLYEWERDKAGSCGDADGCIYLLSSGTSSGASYFIDAGANGDDVFMMTRSALVEADGNEYNDIYDVRIGATIPPAPPQCTGTGCQGVAASPPVFATPSSVTYDGVGNFAAPSKLVIKKSKSKPKKKTSGCTKESNKSKQKSKKAAKSKAKPVLRKAKKAAKCVRRTANERGGR